MNRILFLTILAGLVIGDAPAQMFAQQSSESQPYFVGSPLGRAPSPSTGGEFEAMSSNVKVYGSIYSAESASYDPLRGLIVVPNRGEPQSVRTNDAWVSLINHDGSVHTSRWIGVQGSGQRANLDPPLVLNQPMGSDIVNDIFYVADRDGGTTRGGASVAVIRWFDMETGVPLGNVTIEESEWLNDIEVAEDGTIYATQTGDFGANGDPSSWRVYRVAPDGGVSVFAEGAPLRMPNGIAFDPQGNIVVANYGDDQILTYSLNGDLLLTENAAQPGSDGLVIMPDGTKYVCSVTNGGVSRIRPGTPPELIARNIPNAASMCYDAGANQLVIPMPNHGLAFVPLQ